MGRNFRELRKNMTREQRLRVERKTERLLAQFRSKKPVKRMKQPAA